MKYESDAEYEYISVPTSTWIVIPHADLEVFHDMMHNCMVRVYRNTGTVTLLDGNCWRVRKYIPYDERVAREKLQQVQGDSSTERGSAGSPSST